MEEDPVLVRFDVCRHFAEREHHGRGLGLGQGGVLEGMRTPGMMEDRRRTGQEETHTVGQARRRGRAVAVESTWHGLDIIVAMAAGASEDEIATALGCRPGTVKSRASRALKRLAREVPR